MSTSDPFDAPEMQDYFRHAREELWPKIEGSALNAMFVSDGPPDPKQCLELGYMLMAGKPIVAVAVAGAEVPPALARAADAIVEFKDGDTDGNHERFQAALAPILDRLEAETEAEGGS